MSVHGGAGIGLGRAVPQISSSLWQAIWGTETWVSMGARTSQRQTSILWPPTDCGARMWYSTHLFCSPSRAPPLTGRYLDRVAYMTTPTAGLVGDDRCTRRRCGTSLQALRAQKPHAISVRGAATGIRNQIGRPPACPTRRATWRGSPSRTRPASNESFFARIYYFCPCPNHDSWLGFGPGADPWAGGRGCH